MYFIEESRWRGVSEQDEEDNFWDLPAPEILPVREMLESLLGVNVLAPLVRCSKLPFRHLCSLYETHITHTPMILAQEFSRSQSARMSDFSTSSDERGVFWMEPKASASFSREVDENRGSNGSTSSNRGQRTYYEPGPSTRLPPMPIPPTKRSRLVRGALVAQFASPNAEHLADSAELVARYVDGLDINCGCPQSWAYKEGVGCALLRKPELVHDMIRQVKGRMGWNWPVSIKIRVDPELKLTDQLVKNALAVNVSHITVHGRTRFQKSSDPVSLEGIKFAVESTSGQVPCVGNGDIWSYQDVARMREATGVHGVMAARGLLANPALFAGYETTPAHAVEQFVNLSVDYGFIFPLFQRHLAYMMEAHLLRAERTWFNSLPSTISTIDYLSGRGLNVGRAQKMSPVWDARRGRTLHSV
ncbi:hypothetical protein BD324DRAFT_601451 [Kockovaella imperatae]|uniref:DUS-like FMN-binding domain-containing protein n=1 Tax=Kockovaella imperatae TaxID=4999 RepID=A0A1Y1UHY9_9TREE|nr:hypothetical protein BD324DRAFT_601451 [Kockovaella imperatae]ORX36705.1 hypothetical protein BD324DRAFT_601451 [Kockovaella imperatae]